MTQNTKARRVYFLSIPPPKKNPNPFLTKIINKKLAAMKITPAFASLSLKHY
jgi:hypothetical protein